MILRRCQTHLHPEPQNASDVSPGMNVPNFPEGKRPKATDVSPWYGVYQSQETKVMMEGKVTTLRQLGSVVRTLTWALPI